MKIIIEEKLAYITPSYNFVVSSQYALRNFSTFNKNDFSALGAGENHTYDISRPLTLKE